MATVTEELSLAKVAARIAAEHDDIEEAIGAFRAEVQDNPDAIETAATRGFREFLHDARHQWRGQVKAGERPDGNGQPKPCERNTADAFTAVGEAASRALLEMQVGNKRLGDMTGEELRETGNREVEQGKGMMRSGCFKLRIADKTPAKGLARKSWTNRRLRKLWESLE